MKKNFSFICLIILLLNTVSIFAQKRFPQPEFSSGHVIPHTTTPDPRSWIFEYLDVIILLLVLSLITYFILKKRSRRLIFWTSIFSVIYFGFWKEGCVCSVGSIQNITLALFDKTFIIPVTVIAVFALPLLFALFFGRSFCAGVCYMGAIQELVIFKPVKIAQGLQKALSIIPYVYLSLAVLFAATGSDFIICRYDPFIGFFRMNASFSMLIFGVSVLAIGTVVARPYCRFLCPYGVLLNWMSQLSKWRVTVTPAECIQCKLCENSCPVDAINYPVEHVKTEQKQKGLKRLLLLFILVPLFMFSGGFLASKISIPLSAMHHTVKLAQEVEKEIKFKINSKTQEAIAFHSSGNLAKTLFRDAAEIQNKFYKSSWIMGILSGFILGMALIKSSILRIEKDYIPHKGNCISCGRCYDYCPVKKN